MCENTAVRAGVGEDESPADKQASQGNVTVFSTLQRLMCRWAFVSAGCDGLAGVICTEVNMEVQTECAG